MDRKGWIGASEVGAILGLDPFTTPLALWSRKTGLVEQEQEENEACEWGKRLERVVSAKFAEKNNCKLIAYKKRFIHPTMSFFSCELDNIIAGTEELVEIKTANAWAMKKWQNTDDIPAHYIAQVTAQLGLSGRKIGHFAVLVGGQRYLERKIVFDQEFYNDICQKVDSFWKMVIAIVPPMASGEDNELLVDLHPEASEAMLEATEDMNTAIARRQELCMHIKEMEKEKDDVEAIIKSVISDNLGIRTPKYTVKWPVQISRRIDNEKLKEAGLYEQYLKESSTRVLRITKNKGEA